MAIKARLNEITASPSDLIEQLNDLSQTQIMLIEEIKGLRVRVAALEQWAKQGRSPSETSAGVAEDMG